jgi:hypothetical protein
LRQRQCPVREVRLVTTWNTATAASTQVNLSVEGQSDIAALSASESLMMVAIGRRPSPTGGLAPRLCDHPSEAINAQCLDHSGHA